MSWTRWVALFVVAGFALGVAACGEDEAGAPAGRQGAADEVMQITIGGFMSAHIFLPAIVARDKGFFEEHRLEPEFVNLASGTEVGNAVVTGQVDVAMGLVESVLQLRDKGQDVVAVANSFERQVWSAIMVRNSVPTPNAEAGFPDVMNDLKGQTFGVAARGAGGETVLRLLFELADMDPDRDAEFVATGGVDTSLAALEKGEITAWMWPEPGITMATQELGVAKIAFNLQEDAPPLLDWNSQFWIGSREHLDENPELVERFQAANKDAIEWMKDPVNADAFKAIVARTLNVEDAVAQSVVDSTLSAFNWEMRQEGVEAASDAFVQEGLIKEPVQYDEFVYPGA